MSISVDLSGGRIESRGQRICALLRSLGVLALQKKTWSSWTMLGVFGRIALNPRRHRKVLDLRWNPIYAEHLRRDPRFLFKYLTHDYMARSMSVEERAACFVHHYRRAYAEMRDGILHEILSGEMPLFESEENACCYAISMGLSTPWDKEGEFSLNLRLDGQLIYVLSFSIVPGWVVGATAPEVILIGRLQGERECKGAIARAAKAMRDTAPAAVLLAALEGVGEALAIYSIASVRGIEQTSYRKLFHPCFHAAYDQFFGALGVPLTDKGYYLTAVPIPEKPLAEIKRGHKIRTKAKREIKRRVAAEVAMVVRACRRVRLELLGLHEAPPEAVSPGLYAEVG